MTDSSTENQYWDLILQQPAEMPFIEKVLLVDIATCNKLRQQLSVDIQERDVLEFFQLMDITYAEYSIGEAGSFIQSRLKKTSVELEVGDLEMSLDGVLATAYLLQWILANDQTKLRQWLSNYVYRVRPALRQIVREQLNVQSSTIKDASIAPF